MDLGLAGRKALLFGASRGMGRACALLLAQEGVEVTIVARGEPALREAARAIEQQSGAKVRWVCADLADPAGRARALAACPEPDILLNNGGSAPVGDFHDWPRTTWLAALDALALAPIEMIRLVVDGMIARRFGRIVNIVSRSVRIAQPEHGLSNGARSVLTGFVAGLARGVAVHNVTINNLLPGIFATDAQRHHVEALAQMTGRPFEAIWSERAAASPARRYGEAGEIAACFGWLVSAQAGYVTGQSLMIDGGAYPGTM